MNSYPTEDNSNRIRSVVNTLIGTENSDDIMMNLIDTVKDSLSAIPKVGKYYIFIYQPKTSGIRYDQNPLVAVTDIFNWGFRGINFHFNEYRQYTWNEVIGSFYEIYPDELSDVQELPIAKYLLNT